MIQFEELTGNIPSLGLKAGDYIAVTPADFYCGAGTYIVKKSWGDVLVKCAEMTNGDIHVAETQTESSRVISPAAFRDEVKFKVFAKVILENNMPTVAISELKSILTKE